MVVNIEFDYDCETRTWSAISDDIPVIAIASTREDTMRRFTRTAVVYLTAHKIPLESVELSVERYARVSLSAASVEEGAPS